MKSIHTALAVRSRSRSLLKGNGDVVVIGSTLDGLRNQPLEQIGDDMSRVNLRRLDDRFSRARPHATLLAPRKCR